MGYVIKSVVRIYSADRASINSIVSTIRSSQPSISRSIWSTDTLTKAAGRSLSSSSKPIASWPRLAPAGCRCGAGAVCALCFFDASDNQGIIAPLKAKDLWEATGCFPPGLIRPTNLRQKSKSTFLSPNTSAALLRRVGARPCTDSRSSSAALEAEAQVPRATPSSDYAVPHRPPPAQVCARSLLARPRVHRTIRLPLPRLFRSSGSTS
jgi:hypothetical protein